MLQSRINVLADSGASFSAPSSLTPRKIQGFHQWTYHPDHLAHSEIRLGPDASGHGGVEGDGLIVIGQKIKVSRRKSRKIPTPLSGSRS
jgi:hypothetical protein